MASLAICPVSLSLPGCRPPLPSAVVDLATAPASRSLRLPPTWPEPLRGSGTASARRHHCCRRRGWSPCSSGCRPLQPSAVQCLTLAPASLSLGLPPPQTDPRWGSGPASTRRRCCLPLLCSPSRPVAPPLPCHQAPDPGLVCWGVGFCSPPPPRDRDTGGAPRVSSPLGSLHSLGVESSLDDSSLSAHGRSGEGLSLITSSAVRCCLYRRSEERRV